MISVSVIMRMINLIAGLALLVGISVEVFTGNHHTYSEWYMWLQLVVCVVFIVDFTSALTRRGASGRYYLLNMLLLLISIPYLNILSWIGVSLDRGLISEATTYLVDNNAPMHLFA